MKVLVLTNFKASKKIWEKDKILEGEDLDQVLSSKSLEDLVLLGLVKVIEEEIVPEGNLGDNLEPIQEEVLEAKEKKKKKGKK